MNQDFHRRGDAPEVANLGDLAAPRSLWRLPRGGVVRRRAASSTRLAAPWFRRHRARQEPRSFG